MFRSCNAWWREGVFKHLATLGTLASHMKKDKEVKAPINPEYGSAESHYKREVLVTTAQPFLKRAFFAIWALIDVILIVIFLLTVVLYLVYGSFVENRRIATVGNNIVTQNNISANRQAKDLDVGNSRLFSLGEGNYDFYSMVTNPNSDWYAEFEYYFDTSLRETKIQKGFLLPGDERIISALNQEFSSRPSNPEFIIQDLTWKRVDHHAINDFPTWITDHQGFNVTDATYGFSVDVEDSSIARSTFTIENTSPFSYWNAVFTISLTRGGTVVGLNQVVLQGFESGETRTVDVNWFDGAPSSGTVEIETVINFFDDDVYMDLSSEAIDDVRDRLQ